MTAQVIETKRQPSLWSVKGGNRFKAVFYGAEARAQAEAYATQNYGALELREKPAAGKEQRRTEFLAAG